MTQLRANQPASSSEHGHVDGPTTKTDVLVIGAGSGGLTVAVGLGGFGKKITLLEAADVGGDCTNFGCIPSKSLLHLSKGERLGAGPGSGTGDDHSQGNPVLAKVRSMRDRLRDEETEEFGSAEGVTLRYGRARLLPERGQVEITNQDGEVSVIEAEDIVLATGSRARMIEIPGLPQERTLTNVELFEQTDVPQGLAIVGAGPIGVEMAIAFNRLGSSVTLIDTADRVLPLMLAEASAEVQNSLIEQGIKLELGAGADRYDEPSRTLHLAGMGGRSVAGVDRVLIAVGRRPNVEDLGLEAAGVALASEGPKRGHIEIDSRGRTSAAGIWAVGDVTTEGGTTHAASSWGRRIVRAFLAPYAPAGAKPPMPAVTFSDPEAAMIGSQPANPDDDVRRLTVRMSDIDRGFTDEVRHGIMIVDVRRFSGEILGATVVGPRAGELIATFSLAMKTGVKFHSWSGTVWPYPTYADAIGRLVDTYISETWTGWKGEGLAWVKGSLGRRIRRR